MNKLLRSCLLAMIPIVVNAYDVKVGGIYYNLYPDSKQAEVTSGDEKYSGSVSIPASVVSQGETYDVTAIGERAFYDCNTLTDVVIPEGVTKIGGVAFSWCSMLTAVYVPNSVETIDWFCFSYCTNLTAVRLPGRMESIGYGAFSNCKSLTNIMIPSGLTTIDRFTFEDCTTLTSVVVPEGVIAIEAWAFYGCMGLSDITLPSSLQTLADEVFYYCPSLAHVYCYADHVPTAYSNTFEQTMIGSMTLHVPNQTISSYRAEAPWSGFGSIVPLTETGIVCSSANERPAPIHYTLGGRQVRRPHAGIYVVNGRKVVVKTDASSGY